MSDMKLIMEGWRQYNINEQQCDEMINFINEYYGESVLTEGVIDNLKKRIGPAALGLALAAASVLGMPGEAMAQDAGIELPAAAQQMSKDEARDQLKTPVGKFVKGLLDKAKDVKVKDLLKKKSADASSDGRDASTPDGYSFEDGVHEYQYTPKQQDRDGDGSISSEESDYAMMSRTFHESHAQTELHAELIKKPEVQKWMETNGIESKSVNTKPAPGVSRTLTQGDKIPGIRTKLMQKPNGELVYIAYWTQAAGQNAIDLRNQMRR